MQNSKTYQLSRQAKYLLLNSWRIRPGRYEKLKGPHDQTDTIQLGNLYTILQA